MNWFWRLWRRTEPDGTQARKAVQEAERQKAQAERLGALAERVAKKVNRQADLLAQEVTKALGAR